MDSEEVTLKLLEVVNEGMAGIPVKDLHTLGIWMLAHKELPGAERIGEMFFSMIKLNLEYTRSLEINPLSFSGLGEPS